MQDVLVSIITPTYNSADFIAQTIESVQAQTYANWELLITDDCSQDNTVEIIQRYMDADSRIKLFRLDKNSGGGVARNNSIKMAAGRYIAFCDSDDRWYPEKLAKQLAFMEEKGCAFSYTSYMTCSEAGDIKGIVVAPNRITFSSTQRDNKVGCLTAIYDSQQLGKIYLPLIRKRQDYGLVLRILQKSNEAFGMKEPLAIYRLREGSVSSNKLDLVKYNVGVYVETLGWSKLRAFLFFLFVFTPSHLCKVVLQRLYNR